MVIYDELLPENRERMKQYTRLMLLILKINESRTANANIEIRRYDTTVRISSDWNAVTKRFDSFHWYEDAYDGMERSKTNGSLEDAEKYMERLVKELDETAGRILEH